MKRGVISIRERDIKKVIYLNEKENKRLKKNMAKLKLSESNYFRYLIANYEPRKLPDYEKFSKLIDELKPVGKILNEVAIVANRYDFVDARNYQRAVEKLDEVEERIIKEVLNKA